MSHFYDIIFRQYFVFFMSLFIAEVICSHSFSCKTSQCVCSLWFFVLVLGFLNQLIIIVLCSFDSKQFPEIKKKCCSQTFCMSRLQVAVTHPCCGVRAGEDTRYRTIYPEDYSPKPEFLIHLLSLQWFPFIPKNAIISIQMKSRAEELNTIIYL